MKEKNCGNLTFHVTRVEAELNKHAKMELQNKKNWTEIHIKDFISCR